MIKFYTQLLLESVATDTHIKHLNHIEDGIFDGPETAAHSVSTLRSVYDYLNGITDNVNDIAHISTKTDGSVSLVFGHHPVSGKYFVGTKSVFNKTPKINYTEEDIDKNHGHASGLAETLKHALKHLPKISGKSGVYQSDIVFSEHNKSRTPGMIAFTPNTITYSVTKNHPDFDRIDRAKIGLAVHTKYEGHPESADSLVGMVATPFFGKEKLPHHQDVHITDNRFRPQGTSSNTKFIDNIKIAEATLKLLSNTQLNTIKLHSSTLNTYINKTVRDDVIPTTGGYIEFLRERLQKEVDKAKSEAGKQKKRDAMNDALSVVTDNEQIFDKAFKIHRHLQIAKDVLVKSMDTANHYYNHSYKDKTVSPEGYAITTKSGITHKFVNRAEFSRNNFANAEERFSKK